jgi:hypothetical protein
MGGFSGQVPFPTTDQLAKLVAQGQLRYVLLGARDGGPGGEGNSNVTAWVTKTCTVVTDSTSGVSDLYDCAPRGRPALASAKALSRGKGSAADKERTDQESP